MRRQVLRNTVRHGQFVMVVIRHSAARLSKFQQIPLPVPPRWWHWLTDSGSMSLSLTRTIIRHLNNPSVPLRTTMPSWAGSRLNVSDIPGRRLWVLMEASRISMRQLLILFPSSRRIPCNSQWPKSRMFIVLVWLTRLMIGRWVSTLYTVRTGKKATSGTMAWNNEQIYIYDLVDKHRGWKSIEWQRPLWAPVSEDVQIFFVCSFLFSFLAVVELVAWLNKLIKGCLSTKLHHGRRIAPGGPHTYDVSAINLQITYLHAE